MQYSTGLRVFLSIGGFCDPTTWSRVIMPVFYMVAALPTSNVPCLVRFWLSLCSSATLSSFLSGCNSVIAWSDQQHLKSKWMTSLSHTSLNMWEFSLLQQIIVTVFAIVPCIYLSMGNVFVFLESCVVGKNWQLQL